MVFYIRLVDKRNTEQAVSKYNKNIVEIDQKGRSKRLNMSHRSIVYIRAREHLNKHDNK